MFMVLKRGMMNNVSDFYKEVLSAWGEFVKYVKYDCE